MENEAQFSSGRVKPPRRDRIELFAARWCLLWLLALEGGAHAQFIFATNNGMLTVTGYTGEGGAVLVPETVDGLSVIGIGDRAFEYDQDITSVFIPNTVTSIGEYAFHFCRGLTKVTLGNGLTSIGDYAFYDCQSLTNFTIGKGVTNIGSLIFLGCTSLTAITVDPLNTVCSSVDGVLFDKDQTTLLEFPAGKGGSYSVPAGITGIGDCAFGLCASLTDVTIPAGVTRIGSSAFAYCNALTNVSIPDSVTNMGVSAFWCCGRLTDVRIPANVTAIQPCTFWCCVSLTSVTIPNHVTSIGIYAFLYCYGLTNVIIGSGVTNIDLAFGSCDRLREIYFFGDAPNIHSNTFSATVLVTAYYLPGTAGWGSTLGGRPTVIWLPKIQTKDFSFGVRTNQFGFNLSWASGMAVAVDACTNPANPVWMPLQTNTLTADTFYFSDPQWTNHPARFYRLRWPGL